jgi:ankyrin repeat protein
MRVGIDVNFPFKEEKEATALSVAARLGHATCVDVLIANGAGDIGDITTFLQQFSPNGPV